MPILTPEERLGQDIAGRYRLDAVLSAGGMGVLFDATDETTGGAVAVKMLKPAYSLERDRVARFLRETRIAAELRHPNIALVLEVYRDDTGVPFLIMERLRGSSLEEELERRGRLPLSEALEIVVPVADALALAHASGIVHRDVKPANIFLCRSGESVVPKLLDFGIAKTPGDDFETQTGVVLGTPGYMAPEQAQHGECGPFTDVWALAAVLYRALSGHAPHASASVGDVLAKLVREAVPPLSAAGVPKPVCATIDRALALDPHRRYPDMRSFVRTLGSVAGSCGTSIPRASADDATTQDLPRIDAAAGRADAKRARISWAAAASALVAIGAFLLSRIPERNESVITAAHVAQPAVAPREPAVPAEAHNSPAPTLGVSPPARPAPVETARTTSASRHTKRSDVRPDPERAPGALVAESSVKAFEPSTARPRPAVEREPQTGIPVATEW